MMRFTCFVALACSTAFPLAASALDFDYAKIVDTSTAVPIVGGTFSSLGDPALDGTNVAFKGNGSVGNYVGLFTSNSATLNKVVDTNTPIPNSMGTFLNFDFRSLSGNKLAFSRGGPGQVGIYTSDLIRIADSTTPVPGSAGFQFSKTDSPSISGNNIAFRGSITNGGPMQDGIYRWDGSLQVVANRDTAIPGAPGDLFTSFGTPVIDGNSVAFNALGATSDGIYSEVGNTLHVVANRNSNIPDGTDKFFGFGSPALNSGNVAFVASGTGQLGVYTDIGGLTRVADLTTPIPGGSGSFTSFGATVALDQGSVALIGNGSNGQIGIYTNYTGTLSSVISKQTLLDGKAVTNFSITTDAVSNGNVAFQAAFADGSAGVYVATQAYNFTANSSASWDDSTSWAFGLKPRAVVTTSIHPDHGALITGPAVSTTLRVLDLGSAISGQAELRLQPSGQISVAEYAYVQDRGKLNLNGGVISSNIGLYNYGEIDLAGGQTSGGFLDNRSVIHGNGTIGNFTFNFGRIEAINSQLRFTAGVDNGVILDGGGVPVNVGQINIRNSLVQFGGGLSNNSQVNFSFGTSDVFGAIDNVMPSGSATSSQIIVSGNSNVTFYNQVTHNGSVFRVSPGSTATFFGPVSGAGAFTGTGTKIFEGGFSPGNSPAGVSLEGSVQFTATNTLKIELGGTAVGAQYDKVSVNGALALGGKLELSLLGPFQPALGNTFDILDWNTLTGGFTSVQFPPIAPNLAWNAMQLYQSGVISVVDINLLPGDFNRDHEVTVADISAMLKALTDLAAYQTEKSLTGPQLEAIGDLNLSGTVTNLDLQWLLNIVPALAGNGSLAAVPEPSAFALLAIGSCAFMFFRRGRI